MSSEDFLSETLSNAKARREELRRELKAVEDVITSLEGVSQKGASGNGDVPQSNRFTHWRQVDAAIEVIREKGDWMHVREIAEILLANGVDSDITTLKRSLNGSLSKKDDILSRHPKGAATFGLREWLRRDDLLGEVDLNRHVVDREEEESD